MNQPPNDRRNFVHKRLIGAAVGLVTGGPTAALAGFARGGGPAPVVRRSIEQGSCAPGERRATIAGRPGPCVRETRPSFFAPQARPKGRIPRLFDPLDFEGRLLSRETRGGAAMDPGEAIMGRYGAGLEPHEETRQMSVCLPGMVLGDDRICYNRSQVPNKRRMWPKGRKPLLTGGEMNAITTAARAARRVKATTKKLQSLGLLDRPRPRPRAAAPKALPPAHHTH